MGKIFITHPGGSYAYCCSECQTPLASQTSLVAISKIKSEQGLLFKSVVNLVDSSHSNKIECEAEDDDNYSIVRRVFCKVCTNHLGWRYEFCKKDTDNLKEGKYLLRPGSIAQSQRR